jgi:hypothetical protein
MFELWIFQWRHRFAPAFDVGILHYFSLQKPFTGERSPQSSFEYWKCSLIGVLIPRMQNLPKDGWDYCADHILWRVDQNDGSAFALEKDLMPCLIYLHHHLLMFSMGVGLAVFSVGEDLRRSTTARTSRELVARPTQDV